MNDCARTQRKTETKNKNGHGYEHLLAHVSESGRDRLGEPI